MTILLLAESPEDQSFRLTSFVIAEKRFHSHQREEEPTFAKSNSGSMFRPAPEICPREESGSYLLWGDYLCLFLRLL